MIIGIRWVAQLLEEIDVMLTVTHVGQGRSGWSV